MVRANKERLEVIVAARLPLKVHDRLMDEIRPGESPSALFRRAVDAFLILCEGSKERGTHGANRHSEVVR
jgi:hypothetical protein